MREIGSNFWDFNSSLSDNELFFPNIKFNNVYSFVSGRMALYALIKKLSIKIVMLPAFTCESVIEPFIKCNCKIVYYEVNKKLYPNCKEIKKNIIKYHPQLILFHSYFGFNTNRYANKICNYIKSKNIIIIEDLTQGYFSSFKKLDSDYYISSIRKFFAIPMGGFLFLNDNLDLNFSDNDKIIKLIDKTAIDAFSLKRKYMIENGDKLVKDKYMKKYKELKEMIDNYNDIYPMSDLSKKIYSNIDYDVICKKRRDNYNYLLKELKNIKDIEIIFDNIPKNVVPLYFPIYINLNRDLFQKKLAEKNIYCPIIWPKSNYVNYNSKTINSIYSEILCLPCDQRYDISDMKKICDAIISLNNY